jgi:chromate transporter
MMPGPLAAQLAMWFGYLQAGAPGAAAVALAFVLPACLLVTAVAAIYSKYERGDHRPAVKRVG